MNRHPILYFVLLLFFTLQSATAQVDYEEDYPWSETTEFEPDLDVPGWFYNLGITGVRAQLDPVRPKTLVVKHVFADAPAGGLVELEDRIIGIQGALFVEAHQDGYGTNVFGAQGPIGEFAAALESVQGPAGNGELSLTIERAGISSEVVIPVGKSYGAYSDTYPENCPKSARLEQELIQFLLSWQNEEGHWENPITDTYACLALLAQQTESTRAAVERCARYYTTIEPRTDGLINWDWAAGGTILAEYYQATRAEWVRPELEKIRELLLGNQYTMWPSQVAPEVRESHPESFPNDAEQQLGGWGHNPGFEGYGPHGQLTAQGALVFGMMRRCGLAIDRQRHDSAYDFLARGTGLNGYVWYADEVPDHVEWADMGRTGMASIANWLSTYPESAYKVRAIAHARVIERHPESFPDTHASPPLGMATAAMGTFFLPASFRRLMDANRWWFALAQCHDEGIYYQPNRDNAGYGEDSRLITSAVTAFIFALPRRNLLVSGKVNHDYDIWAAGFPEMDLLDPTADPDVDGRSNLEEWIWGMRPGVNETILIAETNDKIFDLERDVSFIYQRRKSSLTGKRFEVQLSEDLSTWFVDDGAAQNASDSGADLEMVRVNLSPEFRGQDRLFARIRVR